MYIVYQKSHLNCLFLKQIMYVSANQETKNRKYYYVL